MFDHRIARSTNSYKQSVEIAETNQRLQTQKDSFTNKNSTAKTNKKTCKLIRN
jgi:hypothetical protein